MTTHIHYQELETMRAWLLKQRKYVPHSLLHLQSIVTHNHLLDFLEALVIQNRKETRTVTPSASKELRSCTQLR